MISILFSDKKILYFQKPYHSGSETIIYTIDRIDNLNSNIGIASRVSFELIPLSNACIHLVFVPQLCV